MRLFYKSLGKAVGLPIPLFFPPMAVARHPVARIAPPAPAIISASRARVGERYGELCQILVILQCRQTPPPFRGASEAERDQRSPSQNDTDVAGWRRVSCWSHRGALGPSSPARRQSSPPSDRHQQTINVGCRRPSIATHSAAQAAGAGRAPRRSISYACRCPRARAALSERCHQSPLTELLKPDGCRAPPRSSHRAAGARHHQRLARA